MFSIAEPAKPEPGNEMVASYRAERQKYKDLKKQQAKDRSKREDETLSILARFQSRLEGVKNLATYDDEEESDEEKREEEKEEEEEEGDPTDISWYDQYCVILIKSNHCKKYVLLFFWHRTYRYIMLFSGQVHT